MAGSGISDTETLGHYHRADDRDMHIPKLFSQIIFLGQKVITICHQQLLQQAKCYGLLD
jgi:hypothetical protein